MKKLAVSNLHVISGMTNEKFYVKNAWVILLALGLRAVEHDASGEVD